MSLENLKGMNICFQIIQNFPVNRLNRDENGELKKAFVGNTVRQRISSQCWKYAVRKAWREQYNEDIGFRGTRTQCEEKVKNLCEEYKFDNKLTDNIIKKVNEKFFGYKKKKENTEEKEITDKDNLIVEISYNQIKKEFDKILKNKENIKDMFTDEFIAEAYEYDLALFGRMVAQSPKFNINAASSWSHAFSINPFRTEYDYFTATLDEPKTQGAGHLNNINFGDSTMYRFININMNTLIKNLNNNEEKVKDCLLKFVNFMYNVVPVAGQSTLNSSVRPAFVRTMISTNSNYMIDFTKAIYSTDVVSEGINHIKESVDHWINYDGDNIDFIDIGQKDYCENGLKQLKEWIETKFK